MQMNRIGQVVTVTLTVVGWFGLSAQGRYNASRLALEERRLALETERFDRRDGQF